MNSLHAARYRLHVRVTASLSLPDYAGSALRGAFGHALLQVCGLSVHDRDNNTPLFQQSPYVAVFAPQQLPQSVSLNNLAQLPVPYIIEAPLTQARVYQPDEALAFEMVLCGNALQHLAVVILAWRRAFLRGVGGGDGRGELIKVEFVGADGAAKVIYDNEHPRIVPHETIINVPDFGVSDRAASDVHLLLATPLRLQHHGKILGPREITATALLRNLIRRVTLQMQMQQPDAWPLEQIRHLNTLADKVQDERRLAWQEWVRYSSRQKQSIKLGGVTGHWLLNDVSVELLPFIYLGQWLHVGKETAFGLGKYDCLTAHWQPEKKTQSPLLKVNIHV